MTATQKIILVITLLVGILVRTYKIDSPIADWHSHRQADTSSVTKLYYQNGVDILHPKYHDLSNVQSGQDNPNGYRMVEFPIYNVITVNFSKISGLNIDLSGRIIAISLSIASAILIFLFCFKTTHLFLPSYLSLFVFLFLPINIYYSRTILPEPAAVFFMLLAMYLFTDHIFLSAIALALSILIKPYTAIILFPFFASSIFIYQKKYFNPKNIVKLFVFGLVTLVPFLLWRKWIGQFPEGIPKSDWLLNNGVTTTFPVWFHGYNLSFLNKLVAFRPHWFQWLFLERITLLILGGFGIVPLFLGTVFKKNHSQKYVFSFILGILLYFIIIAQGNIQHDYYQVLILPFISIICGFGYYYALKFTYSSRLLSIIVISLIFIFSTYFSWTKVSPNYQIGHPAIVSAGLAVQQLVPKNSLIIAPYNGDTALLFQTGLSGWPTEIYDIPAIIKAHPQTEIYFVSVNFDGYTNSIIPQYKTIIKNNDYIILKLTP